MATDPKVFLLKKDSSSEWEVSFYRSLIKVNAVLPVGGSRSTLIAGQIALGRDLPIIALAEFDGSGLTIWQSLHAKPAYIEEADFEAMQDWTSDSATRCFQSLNGQFGRRAAKATAADREILAIKDKAYRPVPAWD
ncbi:MAG TPA: hypothetical protein VLL54_15010 [Pyrinomonadaceae bacterium]|nr:hypothetical protein [Pyrinomonadaceae bacterium]